MTTTPLDTTDRQVLEAVAHLEARHRAPNVNRIARLSGLRFTDVWHAVNRLHRQGCLTPWMTLTDRARDELEG